MVNQGAIQSPDVALKEPRPPDEPSSTPESINEATTTIGWQIGGEILIE